MAEPSNRPSLTENHDDPRHAAEPAPAPNIERAWPLLFPLAFFFRLTNLYGVLTPAGTFPIATDSFYHLRRIQAAVEHFPNVPDFDRYLNFPSGGPVNWPYMFDILYAAVVKLVGFGKNDPEFTASVCIWLTPIFGSMVPCFAYLLGKRLGHSRIGLVAGALTAILPTVTITGTIGTIDHHVFEPFWFSLYLLFLTGALQSEGDDRNRRRFALGAGVCLTAGIVFTTILPVLIPIHVGLFLWGLIRERNHAERRAFLLKTNLSVAAALVASAAPFVGFRLFEPNGVNPALGVCWLAGFLLACATAALVSVTAGGIGKLSKSTLWELGILGLSGVLVLWRIDFAGALEFARYGLAHVGAADPWLARIQESLPFFGHSTRYLFWSFSGFLAVWPIALAWMTIEGWKKNPDLFNIALVGFPTAAMALLQMKFWGLHTVPHALAVGFLVDKACASWTTLARNKRWPNGNARGFALGGTAAALLLWPTLAVLTFNRPYAVVEGGYFIKSHPTLNWIAERTPPTSPAGDADADYSIAADWNLGHWLVWYAKRPVVASPLGHTPPLRAAIREGAEIFALPPDQALPLLEKHRVRYVLTVPLSIDDTVINAAWNETTKRYASTEELRRNFADGLYARLMMRDGVPDDSGAPSVLRGFRLVHEGADMISIGARQRPFALLFERVRGARLNGRAAPRETVFITADIKTVEGRTFQYRDHVAASETGVFSVTVPYAQGEQRWADARAAGPYSLRTEDGKTAVVSVAEADLYSQTNFEVNWTPPARPAPARQP